MNKSKDDKPVVVVAGFGSWAVTAVNPAAQAVNALVDDGPDNCHLHCLEVPVDSEALHSWLENTLQEYKPDVLIGVGVAVESPVVKIESIGINVRCFSTPDNRGMLTDGCSIADDGPVAYQSNLEHQKIVQQLLANNIPSVVSFHAGTHLCNQMLYSMMHHNEKNGLTLLGGFVHVPQSTDNVARSAGFERLVSSMSIPMMTRALAVTVTCAVHQYSLMAKPV